MNERNVAGDRGNNINVYTKMNRINLINLNKSKCEEVMSLQGSGEKQTPFSCLLLFKCEKIIDHCKHMKGNLMINTKVIKNERIYIVTIYKRNYNL